MPSSSPSNCRLVLLLCNKMDSISLAYNLLAWNGILARKRFRIHDNMPWLAASEQTSERTSVMFSKIADENKGQHKRHSYIVALFT